MSRGGRLQWFGGGLKRRLRNAQVLGVDRTMADAVHHAKAHHEFRNRTATLEGSVRVTNFATPHLRGARGMWGSADVRYALRIELGFEGADRAGRRIRQRPRPFLRPAAEATYPRLPHHIREALKR